MKREKILVFHSGPSLSLYFSLPSPARPDHGRPPAPPSRRAKPAADRPRPAWVPLDLVSLESPSFPAGTRHAASCLYRECHGNTGRRPLPRRALPLARPAAFASPLSLFTLSSFLASYKSRGRPPVCAGAPTPSPLAPPALLHGAPLLLSPFAQIKPLATFPILH